MAKILVVDDEQSIRSTLKEVLEYEGYVVEEAADGPEAKTKIEKESYDVVLCDIKMPKMDGLELLDIILEKDPDIPVIMISGHGTIETAVDAIKKGAYDYISKPPDIHRLLITVRNALDRKNLVKTATILKTKVSKGKESPIIGESRAIKEVKAMIEKVAPTDARVLILGPNGTGKELVARQIHALSARAKGPFVEVNCAAIPADLIESELFGHEKGAFTSAIKQRKGCFEQAENGTLFLDEIGDMSLAAQAKVLRALQENKITRVGGEKEIPVNVRVIAATNKDIDKMREEGTFREDLYHRLNVITIHVPPLKDRIEDIPLLVEHFNNVIASEYGIKPKNFEKDAIEALKKLPWPGNIRELRNVVERLMILCDQNVTKKDIEKYVKS
ncbi:MAG: Fis family transcriptional regulator [Vicingaceae bacterium]|nr:MAG: Fis family transcriptional regulator [Vicingaceae bacterium]